MTNVLTPCDGCGRHIRVLETACPFCGVAAVCRSVPEVRALKPGLGRAALFTVGAAMIAAAGCSDDGMTPPGGFNDAYGAPPWLGDADFPDADLPDADISDADMADADGDPSMDGG